MFGGLVGTVGGWGGGGGGGLLQVLSELHSVTASQPRLLNSQHTSPTTIHNEVMNTHHEER